MLSQIDRDLSSRDNSLPNLKLILDTEYIRSRISSSFPSIKLQKVQNVYVGYKPYNKCLVLHDLITEECTFRAYSQIYSSKEITKESKRLKDTIKVNNSKTKGCQLTSKLSNSNDNILTYFLPIDRRLKNIAKLYDADLRNSLFNTKLPNNDELIDCEIVPLNYKPEKRYVAKLTKNNYESSVIKLYNKEFYKQAVLNADLYINTGSFKVPKFLKKINKLRCLIYKWVDGDNLNIHLFNNNPDLDIIKRVGSSLSDLNNQKITNQLKFDKKYFIYKLLSISQDVSYLLPNISVKLNKIVNRVSELLLRIPDVYVPIHGDFYSDQLIVDNKQGTVCLLDFDQSCLGHPAYDIGNFLAHYIKDSYKVGLNSDAFNDIKQSIIDGYRCKSKINISDEEINVFTVACLIRLLTDPFKYRYESWDKSIYNLLEYINNKTDKLKNKAQSYINDELYIQIDDKFSAEKDARMPFLKYALDPEYMQSLFNINYKDGACINSKLSSIKVIRYKKEKRCLFEYKFYSQQDVDLIGKTRASGSVKNNYKINKEIYSSGFNSSCGDNICIPKPLFHVPNINMWYQKKISGQTYTDLVTKGKDLKTARLIAEAAYKIHRCNVAVNKNHTTDGEMQILTDCLDKVSSKKLTLTGRIQDILTAGKVLAYSIPKPDTCCIHRDFYADQLIIRGEKIYIVDFDLFCNGDPALDIGNFIGHLTELSIRTKGSADGFIEIENEIEKHYLNISSNTNSFSIQAYKTLTLLRHIYISTLFADRCAFTEKILNLCEQRLIDFT